MLTLTSPPLFFRKRSPRDNSLLSTHHLKVFLKLWLCLFLFLFFSIPDHAHAFNLNTLIDDVTKTAKKGADSLGKEVKKIMPEENKNEEKELQANKPQPPEAKDDSVASTRETSVGQGPEAGSDTGAGSVENTTIASPANAETMGTVFSGEPINPETPPVTTPAFVAGDRIYGMLRAEKPWKALLGSSNYLILYFYIDGEEKIYRTIGLKRPDLLERDYFIIDIAPDPAGMTNYTDQDIVFPEKDGYKFGPELFTSYLSRLQPGNHTIRLEVKAYGDVYAAGEFTISGDNYEVYATLLGDIKNSSGKMQRMPKPGMTSLALENEMIQLLKDAGWPEIRRLVIVDKDWWLDRIAGGDSAYSSRHIEAAAAAGNSTEGYYYCHVTFHQPMLITGNWGPLAITRTGTRKPIPEQNIDL